MNKRFLSTCCALLVSSLVLAGPLHIPGDTSEARMAFLRALPEDSNKARSQADEYFLAALRDPAYEVRSYAAYSLRGNQYIDTLVRVVGDDPDPRVRNSAAQGLGHWLTDNGTDTCNGAPEVVPHVDSLIKAMGDIATFQPVVDILGFRYSGDLPLPCCMPYAEQQRILTALADVNGRLSKGFHEQLMTSKHRFDFNPGTANMAKKQIEECAKAP
jgi:hypothetical protein